MLLLADVLWTPHWARVQGHADLSHMKSAQETGVGLDDRAERPCPAVHQWCVQEEPLWRHVRDAAFQLGLRFSEKPDCAPPSPAPP